MKCKFCLKEKKLIEAHIVPWCFIKGLTPEGEKYEPVVLMTDTHTERRSKGSYDKGILCAECDNFLGTLDGYAKTLLKEENLVKKHSHAYLLRNSGYKKFGMFILSVIWRASTSSRKEFSGVSLGRYEEESRKTLLEYSLQKEVECPDYFCVLMRDNKLPREIVEKNIMLPLSYKFHSVNVTQMVLPGGFKILMKFDQRNFPLSAQRFVQLSKTEDCVWLLLHDRFSETNEFKWMLDNV